MAFPSNGPLSCFWSPLPSETFAVFAHGVLAIFTLSYPLKASAPRARSVAFRPRLVLGLALILLEGNITRLKSGGGESVLHNVNYPKKLNRRWRPLKTKLVPTRKAANKSFHADAHNDRFAPVMHTGDINRYGP